MSLPTIKAPWCFWVCPQCDGEGCVFNLMRFGVNCVHCGHYDDSSDMFHKCIEVDSIRRQQERKAELRRQREAIPALTISPLEWADGPTEVKP